MGIGSLFGFQQFKRTTLANSSASGMLMQNAAASSLMVEHRTGVAATMGPPSSYSNHLSHSTSPYNNVSTSPYNNVSTFGSSMFPQPMMQQQMPQMPQMQQMQPSTMMPNSRSSSVQIPQHFTSHVYSAHSAQSVPAMSTTNGTHANGTHAESVRTNFTPLPAVPMNQYVPPPPPPARGIPNFLNSPSNGSAVVGGGGGDAGVVLSHGALSDTHVTEALPVPSPSV